ncbi:MAG TPA: hypothetical protein VGM50_09640 [Gemmatimonadaceae bacterium]
MTSPAQRGARATLDAARPAVARLDATCGSEDLAADLIDIWNSVESALRALVGSSALAGQALIREARQRQMISFELANSLAEFEAVNARLHDTTYRPTDGDVNAARTAFLKLDAEMSSDTSAPSFGSSIPRPAPQAPNGLGPKPSDTAWNATKNALPMDGEPVLVVNPTSRRSKTPIAIGIAILVVVLLGAGSWALFGRSKGGSLQQGADAYRAGQREVAVSAFTKATREDPKDPLPHIYLARMAREVGNFTLTTQELQTALQLEPTNALALREMGATMLAKGDNELARRFYVHAIEADATDKTSQGYLGCALMRLNRVSEGTTFLNRAGPGPWSNCTPIVPQTTPARAPASIPR